MKFTDTLKSLRFRLRNTYPYRRYFVRHECIFIHIPKSAGTSILKLLAGGDRIYRDHAGWFEYYRHDPIRYRHYFKFAVVRDPFDRAVSAYTYLRNGGNQKEDLIYQERLAQISFERFVLDHLDQYTIHEHLLFRPQYLFLYDRQRTLKVDFLARFENLDADLAVVTSRLGLDADTLQKLNKSAGSRETVDYFSNPAVVDKIVSLYRYDFELLGYNPKRQALCMS